MPIKSFTRSVLPLLVLVVVGCRPRTPDGIVDKQSLGVTVGVGGLAVPGRWSRLLITASTESGVFDGELIVRGVSLSAPSAERFRHPIALSEIAQTFELPFLQRHGFHALDLTFRGSSSVQSFRVDLRSTSRKFRVLGVGSVPPAILPSLASALELDTGDVALASFASERMPRNALGWDDADLVIAFGDEVGGADDDQLRALTEWVERGGVLVGVPGPVWATRAAETFGAPFGVTRALEMARSTDFLRREPLGAGRRFVLPYRNSSGEPAELISSNLARLWREVAMSADPRRRPMAILRDMEFEHASVAYLSSFENSRFPPRWNVAGFVLGYIFVGLVLSRLLFRRRKELAFVVAILLSAASCVGILYLGLLSGIKELSVRAVTYGVVRPDGKSAEIVSWFGVSSPTRNVIDLDVLRGGGRTPFVARQPSSAEDPGDQNLLPFQYEVARSVTSTGAVVHPNSTRLFRIDRMVELDGEISARWADTGLTKLEIRNTTSMPLGATICVGGRTAEFGFVAAGAESTVRDVRDLSWRSAGSGRNDYRFPRRDPGTILPARLAAGERAVLVVEPRASFSGLDAIAPLQREGRALIVPIGDRELAE